ncbi:MAG: M48 family metalloprotease [Betaproteobacteria bacterium]|nr:M48 family metalloprotease [Betaproteobacteria bacterium]
MSVLGVLILTDCAQHPVAVSEKTAPASETPAAPAGAGEAGAPVSDQQEIRMGAQGNTAVLKEYAVLDAPALQAYVNAVGQRLAKQSPRAGLPWHFTVVDSPDVNAFSLPGGYVYVTRGLLTYLNSEAELAAVVGHEIGHVNARHALRWQNASPAAPATGAALGSILMPPSRDQAGADVLQSLGKAFTAGYGPEYELEADRLGAGYLAAAGYDPQAMVKAIHVLKNQKRFFVKQAARDRQPPPVTYHGIVAPDSGDDAGLQRAVADARASVAIPAREGRADYLQKLVGLYFGDSPDQGMIRNNALLHEKLGLAIQFPVGWRVRNRPDRVVATNPAGDAVVELEQGPANDDPMETLRRGVTLDAGARYDSGHLGGYPAAFAAGTQQGKPAVVAVVVFNGTQYLIGGMTRDALAYERERGALRAAINSFHAITPAEQLAARPYVLQLMTARSGLTMAALARRSPLGIDAESELRLLNDLYPGGEPKPGQRLKIVE